MIQLFNSNVIAGSKRNIDAESASQFEFRIFFYTERPPCLLGVLLIRVVPIAIGIISFFYPDKRTLN
jgi:hypothetical protein